MNKEKLTQNILTSLQLSLAIGSSLDFKENIEYFIKTLMSRKNIEKSWVVLNKKENVIRHYSFPESDGRFTLPPFILNMEGVLNLERQEREKCNFTEKYHQKALAVFQLKEIGYLFIYSSVRERFSDEDINLLRPIISKFTYSIKASILYEKSKKNQLILKRLYEENPLPMIILDKKKRKILKVNSAAAKLYGYKKKEFRKKQMTFLQENKEEQHIKKGKEPIYSNHITKNGEKLEVELFINSVYYKDKSAYIIVVEDITKKQKLSRELKEAKEVAEASVRSKELFLANMSHEIRTPMNAILGLGDLLKETNLSNKQYKYVSTINTSGKNLLTIINDILDFTKIEAGKLEMESIPFDIVYSIEKTIEVFEPIAKEQKLLFKSEIDKKLRKEVLGDPTRLNQVLINLLGNAFKFTEKGTINLTVELINKTKSNYRVRFSVKDSGIGISSRNLETIFDSFTQAESSTARLYGGTGLGLAICHQLIKLMGGSLEVSSKIGIGTEFHFTIDLDILKTRTMINNVPNITLPEGIKVLLVEDNKVNQFLAQTILNQWNCEIDCAENGLIAIEKTKKNLYDIILMDIRMPVMNGEEATTIIRKKLNITTPIVALTANAIKGDKEKYLTLGMNGYISKPFNKQSLKEALLKWANNK